MSNKLQPQNHGEDYVVEVKWSDGTWSRFDCADMEHALEQVKSAHDMGLVARVYVRTWRLL